MDDLKAKLASQEVELKQKNEDADKLILKVGVETEKVIVSFKEYVFQCILPQTFTYYLTIR